MARVAASIVIFVTFLFFLFSFSSARDIHDPFSRSEPEAVSEIHRDSSKPLQPDTVSVTLDSTRLSDHVPLTFISFRPINRHIPRRPLPLSFGLGRHHRCRHGNNLKPRRLEIPYGNDAIVRSDFAKEMNSFDLVNRGGVRQIPAKSMRIHHVEPTFSEVRTHHHYHDHHKLEHEHGHREREHEEKGKFMKRIREFLSLF